MKFPHFFTQTSVEALLESYTGDDNEEENEIVMDEPKWNVGDHVVVEDSRVGASRKLFWEVLAVVKSREYVSGE